MELRYVDPKTLHENPNNPRQIKADPAYDEQLAVNIANIGLIQPPRVIQREDGELQINAGHRRVRACIANGDASIPVLVCESDDQNDNMRSFAENIVRTNMNTVDIWRTIQALTTDGWSEDAVATALTLPARTVRRLKLCGSIHPAILDQMAKGDEPSTSYLKTIASAPLEDQVQAWKKLKPKKGSTADWWNLAKALEKRRLYARDASFGPDLAESYGIVWEEDLFAEGDSDHRYTTDVQAYLGAQHEWLTKTLPKSGTIVQCDDYGRVKLPPKAQEIYGKPSKGDKVAMWVDERTGAVRSTHYRLPTNRQSHKPAKGDASSPTSTTTPVTSRPPVTKDGIAMIGDFRTEALHSALIESQIDDQTLIGLLVLALAGKNVDVRTGLGVGHGARELIASQIAPDGVLVTDTDTIRNAAREMLRYTLSLREKGYNANSGDNAVIAGQAITADAHLPNMGTPEFLGCLSKAETEQVAADNGVTPKATGKATRAALLEQLDGQRYVYPRARFALSDEEIAEHRAAQTRYRDYAERTAQPDDDAEGNDPDAGFHDDSPAESAADAA